MKPHIKRHFLRTGYYPNNGDWFWAVFVWRGGHKPIALLRSFDRAVSYAAKVIR